MTDTIEVRDPALSNLEYIGRRTAGTRSIAMDRSSPSGAALLIAGYTVEPVAHHASLVQTLGQLGEALLAANPAWRITRLAPGARADQLPGYYSLERELTSLGARALDVAVVVVVGNVIRSHGAPAFATTSQSEAVRTASSLSLTTIRDRLRAASATNIVLVLAGWSDPAAGAGNVDELDRDWLAALATGRPGDLIAVGADARAVRTIETLRDAFAGDAVDEATGTVTFRSLGNHLAREVPGLAIVSSTLPDTIVTPAPLTSHWDPRLTRRSRRPPAPAPRERPEPDPLVGVTLPGRFRLDSVIARGGFGTVYRARQLSVERDVALKILHAEFEPTSPGGRLFVHEIQSVGRIDHPNVVRIYQADVTPGGRLFFAMELLEGRDLEQAIQVEGRMGLDRALALVDQLLAGLGAAHEAGLIHADIKPANVLLVPGRTGERVVLVDFGLSRLRAPDQPTRSVGGTPAYMAPEQLSNGRVDARSDLFAVALVLVTLMTGWRRRSRDALVPPLDEIADPRLRNVLRRALALDPAERFATAGELADTLAGRAGTPHPDRPLAHAPLPVLAEVMSDRLRGRDREVEELSDHVIYRRAVVLAGRAGIGKTTLLRRGVIPRLTALGMHVVYVACHPGSTEAMAAELAHGIDPAASDVAVAVARWHARAAGKLVLVVDQLEVLSGGRTRDLDQLVRDALASDRWPADADVAVVACVRTPSSTALRVGGAEAVVVMLGLLDEDSAREAIVGSFSELRLTVDEDLLAPLLRDLTGVAARELAGEASTGVYPPHLLRACSILYDALAANEARLTRAHYERSGGAAIIGERADTVPAGPAHSIRRRIALVAALLAICGTAVALGIAAWRSMQVETPPKVVVGGSGTVLFGFLRPVQAFLAERSATSIPISSTYDVGSSGGMRSLKAGEIDIAALSARFDRAVPPDLRAAGKLLVEVAVGFDETALFVRRENPMRRIDIAAIRAHLCCGHGQELAPMTWADLGLSTPPFAGRTVGWTVFGRASAPLPHDSTSSTLLQADLWLCDPQQLCASGRPADVEANEVLARLATDADVLVLSTRSFSTDQVVPLAMVDSRHHTRLDGRKVLWLYLAVERDRPISAPLCRFLDAVLDPSLAGRLAIVGKAEGLPDAPRRRQRDALGLEDGSCARRAIGERASSGEIEGGILRSPIAAAIEITERWIAEPP
jgi:hypothetical protein